MIKAEHALPESFKNSEKMDSNVKAKQVKMNKLQPMKMNNLQLMIPLRVC